MVYDQFGKLYSLLHQGIVYQIAIDLLSLKRVSGSLIMMNGCPGLNYE